MTLREYDFAERLAFSRGTAENSDMETIMKLIPGCADVKQAPPHLDRRGIDFIATLRRGATINIDLKTRERGCSEYWSEFFGAIEPELALEIWSVLPESGNDGVVGWTLDESKLTDYTLHTFDHSDTRQVFLLPFQLLRVAFRKHLVVWRGQFRTARQSSGAWKSECVFVPAWCVLEAVQRQMSHLPMRAAS